MPDEYHLDKLHRESTEHLDALAAQLWPDLVKIEDSEQPDIPYLDEVEVNRNWLR